jgi:hypothetical protein
MQGSPLRAWLRLIALFSLLFLPLSVSLAIVQPTYAQSAGDQRLETEYFTIYYPSGEEEAAEWYAGFADDVNTAVAEMLGQEPVSGLTLRIYATEADYIAANPAAEQHAGILAHAIPDQLEVGVAVERLRQVEPEIARQSFRHEMTHIVAGVLSNQRLPIGFQEALAQYNELSTRRAQEAVQSLKNAEDQGAPLLAWFALNDRATFMAQPDLAYPESYSMMAFLAEKYGMGTFGRFLENLSDGSNVGNNWSRAFRSAYRKSLPEIEQEWREYLPTFLKDGWQTNVLAAYDLSPGVALYEAGHFDEAKEHFAKSKALYEDLGREERAQAASDYLDKAEAATQADREAVQARQALESYDYRTALEGAKEASASFTTLALTEHSDLAMETATLAQRGLEAIALLESARGRLNTFDVPGARAEARQAGQTFAELGDTAHAQEANSLVAGVSSVLLTAGWGALTAGMLAVLVGAYVVVLRPRRRRLAPVPARVEVDPIREENASWL